MDYNTEEPAGFIQEFYIIPKWRKQGIGEALLREAILHFKQLGYDLIQLNIYAGNNARSLYEKNGFYEVSAIMQKYLHE
jgi:ribosomal protein S18 acetylase RimI-like enzyme